MTKYLLRLLTCLCPLLLSPTLTYASELPTPLLFINDKLTSLTHSSKQTQDKIYIPLRAVGKLLGFEVFFDASSSTVNVSHHNNTFVYNLKQNTQFFNDATISISAFIKDDLTYIDAKTFFSLFGFDVDYDQTLFVSHFLGQELLDLEYLTEPILIDLYDDVPVTSVLLNEIQPSTTYSNKIFGTKIIDYFYQDEQTFLTFTPYTLIACPTGYNTLSTPYIINFDSSSITLPLASTFNYHYLLSPDTYATSSNLPSFSSKLDRGEIYLAELTTSNAQITSLKQLYTP